MNPITISDRLDIPQAIAYTTDSFMEGKYAFVVNYKDRLIVVEEMVEDYDPMHPVVIDNAHKPRTAFAKRIKAKHGFIYWIGIGHACTSPRDVTLAHVIEAFMNIEFIRLSGTMPDRDIIDGAIYTYMTKHLELDLTENEMVDMMLKYHNVLFPSLAEKLSMFARELIHNRKVAAEIAIKEGCRQMSADPYYNDEAISMVLHHDKDSESYNIAALVYLQRKRSGKEH